jgi:hypothetical protein
MVKMVDVEHRLLKEWSNSDGSYKIRAFEDNTYEIIENGKSRGVTDLNHWYNPDGTGRSMAVQHIENDISSGYYPKLVK